MKNFERTLLILLILILIVMPLMFIQGLRISLRETFGLDYIGKDELCTLFMENKPIFDEASSILSKLDIKDNEFNLFGEKSYPLFKINQEYTIEKQYALTSTSSFKKLKYGMVMRHRPDVKIDKSIINDINHSNINKILCDFDFERIDVGNEYVLFVNKHAGFIAAILYTTLDVSDSVYRCETEKLAENWYCFISE